MAGEFWLSDAAWRLIVPHLPTNQPGARRKDDRTLLSVIVHALRSGCRWQDCPSFYVPSTTVYSRFHRWSQRGIWQALFAALAAETGGDIAMLDSSAVRRTAPLAAEKGGQAQAIGRSHGGRTTKIHALVDGAGRLLHFQLSPGHRQDITLAQPLLAQTVPSRRLLADKGYDASALRRFLAERGAEAVIPNKTNRRRILYPFDAELCRQRNVIERMFAKLKDFRRLATRYDKLTRNFASAIALCATLPWWTH